LIGPAIEQGEDSAPRASEQKVPETVVCTHSENNCTQDENAFQGLASIRLSSLSVLV
jgi:hypothetical protein